MFRPFFVTARWIILITSHYFLLQHIIMALLAAGVHVEVSNTGAVDGDDIALAKTRLCLVCSTAFLPKTSPLPCVFHCLRAGDTAIALCIPLHLR